MIIRPSLPTKRVATSSPSEPISAVIAITVAGLTTEAMETRLALKPAIGMCARVAVRLPRIGMGEFTHGLMPVLTRDVCEGIHVRSCFLNWFVLIPIRPHRAVSPLDWEEAMYNQRRITTRTSLSAVKELGLQPDPGYTHKLQTEGHGVSRR